VPVHYPLFPHHATHPVHLQALGRWCGVPTGAPEQVSVLELGCAAGGNLLPMAVRRPDWSLVGIDLSAAEIARGERLAGAAGATLQLHCGDVAQVGDLGRFDVVVAHGLLSWVPEPVADAIFALVRRSLAPGGVAYLSYNVAEGWAHRGQLRRWLLDQVGAIDDEQARVDAARERLPRAPAPVAELAAQVAAESDAYLSQDYLARFNRPYRYEALAATAAAHGLQPLCDANAESLALGAPWLPAAAAAAEAAGDDPVARCAWHDGHTQRAFRSTVLARAEDVGRRRGPHGLWLTTELRPVDGVAADAPGPTTFAHPWGARATIGDPRVKQLLAALGAIWPAALPYAEVEAELGPAAEPIVSVLVGSNLVHPRTEPGRATALAERPLAPADVRVMAAEGAVWAAGAHHRGHRLDERDRQLLPLLDGQHTVGELADALGWPDAQVDAELGAAADRGLRIA